MAGHDHVGELGEHLERVGPGGGITLERERSHSEEAEVTGEEHVGIGDEHHEVTCGVTRRREDLDACRELRGGVDEVRHRSGAELVELVELVDERGHERLVRVERHRLVEQRARGRRAQDHRIAEQLRAADVVDVGMSEHDPLHRKVQLGDRGPERLPLGTHHHRVDHGEPVVIDDHAGVRHTRFAARLQPREHAVADRMECSNGVLAHTREAIGRPTIPSQTVSRVRAMLTDVLRKSKFRVAALVVGVVLAATGLAACVTPITPSVVYQQSTFEGFPVISYVPQNPRGMIYLFHGSGGSADFATKVDTVDVLNKFVAEGYGFVSTSSTERTGDKRWDAANPSLTTSPDLARLVRLQAHLVATTPLDTGTPLAGIGMSNGARFVTLWGETWKDAGYPVKVIWASHGKIADPVVATGGLSVPTVFSTSKNDFTVPPFQVAVGYQLTAQAGTPAVYLFSQERALAATTYPRIPGVDGTEANAIVTALEGDGRVERAGCAGGSRHPGRGGAGTVGGLAGVDLRRRPRQRRGERDREAPRCPPVHLRVPPPGRRLLRHVHPRLTTPVGAAGAAVVASGHV